MPAVERLLFAIGAIAIVMVAMTFTTRPPKGGLRNWGGEPPAASAEGEVDRVLGNFTR